MDREYMRKYYRRMYENPCDLVVAESEEFKVNEEHKDKIKKKSPLQIQRVNSDKIIKNIHEKKNADISLNQSHLYPIKSNSSLCIKMKKCINSSTSVDSESCSYSPVKNILFSSKNLKTKEKVQKWLLGLKNNTNQSNISQRNILQGTGLNYTTRMNTNQILNPNNTTILKNVKRRNNRKTMSLFPINKDNKYGSSSKKDEFSNTIISSLERQLSSNTSRTFVPKEVWDKNENGDLDLMEGVTDVADENQIMKVYGALAKYFPSWVGYNMAKCGGCIRACVSVLEK